MPASVDKRLSGSNNLVATSGSTDNASAVATMAAGATTKNYVRVAIISYGPGALAAGAHRATLAYTYAGNAKTIGFSVSTGATVIEFGNNPIEGDENTAITLTLAASGTAGVFGESCLVGFSTKT